MKDTFKRLITDFQERDLSGFYPRDLDIPTESKKIVALVGVRRSGKTSLLFNIINKMREKQGTENLLYVNFEDDRLFPLKLENLDELVEAYFELFPEKRKQKVYFFLDEVQVVDGWEKFIRRIYDTLNIQIFITGSSAKLLSREIATGLRGRTLTFEVFPLSFKEYLHFRNIEIKEHSSQSRDFIKNAFDDYVREGGFPETIGVDKNLQKKILSDYLEMIIYRDIVERFGVQNRSFLKTLIKYCFSNAASLISFSKMYHTYRSLGYRVGKDTVFDYVAYLEDAYAAFTTPIFRNSIREVQRNPKKFFVVDNGLKNLFETDISEDLGKLYENLVFLQLRRQTSEVFYYKGKQEVDFYAKIEGKPVLINVSYDISQKETFKREVDGLLEAMNSLQLKESYLLINKGFPSYGNMVVDGKKIFIKPLWMWLLDFKEPESSSSKSPQKSNSFLL